MRHESSIEAMQDIQRRNPEIEIRDEQLDALDAIVDSELAGYDSTLFVMPPGIGKTVVMAADTLRRLKGNPESRGLFLCDSNNILNQSRERFEKLVGPDHTYGLFSGDGRDYDELSVLFGSFQVMREWRHAFLQNEFDFGIVDEAHHGMAPSYEPTLRYFRFGHLLGGTATPDRFDVKDIRDIFGLEAYSLSLADAIRQRLVADVDYHVITDELVDTGVVEDDYGEMYSMQDFNRTVFAPKRDEEIARIALEHQKKIKGTTKTIGFCKSIEQAERMSRLFAGSEAFHSGLPKSDRRTILEAYRSGDISALFTVDMFNEGIDIPEANQILLIRQTGSKTIYLQQLGRGLRKTASKKKVQVLDFVDNADHLLMVDRYWRDVTGRKGLDNEQTEILEIAMSSIQFDEKSLNALRILKEIESEVYWIEQSIPSDAIRLTQVANQLKMSRSSLKTLASSIGVVISIFPTLKGGEVPYLLADDIERLTLARKRLFG